MDKRVYISEDERRRCQKVADAFAELYELEHIVVMDVGRYGFVKLQYYIPERGFENVITFTDSKSMFEDLWQEWLDTRLYLIGLEEEMDDPDYEEVYQKLPKEKQQELISRKADFARMAGMHL
jgi:hypothetical protein